MIKKLMDDASIEEVIDTVNEVINELNKGNIRRSNKQKTSKWYKKNTERIIDRLRIRPVPNEILTLLSEDDEDLFIELTLMEKTELINRANFLIHKHGLDKTIIHGRSYNPNKPILK